MVLMVPLFEYKKEILLSAYYLNNYSVRMMPYFSVRLYCHSGN